VTHCRVLRLSCLTLLAALAATPPDAALASLDGASPLRPVHVRGGDTLMTLLQRAGVAGPDAQDAVDALKPIWDPRGLQVGEEIDLGFAGTKLVEVRFSPDFDENLVVVRGTDGHFTSYAEPRPTLRAPKLATGVIRTSLFDAANDAGVPPAVLADMIHAFSYDVDFQREVQPGDSFELVYEHIDDENGNPIGAGNIAYAEMVLSGKALRLYRFVPAGGQAGYYTAHGESSRKALLRTPVDGARISSGFGVRHHPILGYTKMHRGVDFAVPTGTPIMAAGDGVVEVAQRRGGFGNLVVLRHSETYETAYGHMSRFARGMRPGVRVHQGDVIGFVGATGLATGPHLHYEVRIDGDAINPLSVKMATHERLGGKDLLAFQKLVDKMERQAATLKREPVVASAAGRRSN
jgi:murein DD-endopeptidase MepM/ murein hydrolase activator NlpD